jgi:hypothetical protein
MNKEDEEVEQLSDLDSGDESGKYLRLFHNIRSMHL